MNDPETILLDTLKKRPEIGGQRDLARTIGLSLGMTNVLLKKLIDRGWVLVRRANARKLQYALTAEGLREWSLRSYRYLKKTVQHIADYRRSLEVWVRAQKEAGCTGVLLRGHSELDFLVEAIARREGLDFRRETGSGPAQLEGWSVLYSENEEAQPNLLSLAEA